MIAAALVVLAFAGRPMLAQASTWPERTDYPRLSRDLETAITRAAEQHGVPRPVLRAFAVIESGGRAGVTTGSYHGVYQLSQHVFRKYGGRGNIFDLNENTNAAARKLRAEMGAFSGRYGRMPTAVELYMIHQQGIGGAAMHMAQPDIPAWQNMYRTDEGKKRGQAWARLAIWGNVPKDVRALFPAGVDGMTSRQFVGMWEQRMARLGGDSSDPSAVASLI